MPLNVLVIFYDFECTGNFLWLEYTGRFVPFHHLYQMSIELIHNYALENKNVKI